MEKEQLKQVFVGKKYEKFEKKVFSIPAFLFGGIYFAYRKMLLLAIIFSTLLSVIDALASTYLNLGLTILTILCIHISAGLYFPLLYRKFYNKKVDQILSKNSTFSEEKILTIMQKAGGTSILIMIIFIIINSTFISTISKYSNNFLDETKFTNNSTNSTSNISANKDSSSNSKSANYKTLENVVVQGYASAFGKTQLHIYYNDKEETLNCNIPDYELLNCTNNYTDEITLNLFYTEKNNEKTIVGYELYNKETNEKIENFESEDALRKKLGYYPEGEYTEELILIKKDDTPGFGFSDNEKYIYYNLIFKTDSGKELEFTYKMYDDNSEYTSKALTENEKYKVKFTVSKGSFDEYEYIITDIENI